LEYTFWEKKVLSEQWKCSKISQLNKKFAIDSLLVLPVEWSYLNKAKLGILKLKALA